MVELCLTLAEKSTADLQDKINLYDGVVPIMEIRLDFLDPLVFPALPSRAGSRYLATCRPLREGGRYEGSESDRVAVLLEASRRGFSFIDLEHDVRSVPGWGAQVRVVRSRHDFEGCPAELDRLFRELGKREGEIAKLAVTPRDTCDLVRLLELMEKILAETSGIILGMGPLGRMTRIVGPFLGAAWTYVAESGNSVAPGQFSLDLARDVFRLSHTVSIPALYGVAGIAGSARVEQAAFDLNLAFRDSGTEALALPLPGLDLELFLPYARASRLPYRGFLELENESGPEATGQGGEREGTTVPRLLNLDGGDRTASVMIPASGDPVREALAFWRQGRLSTGSDPDKLENMDDR